MNYFPLAEWLGVRSTSGTGPNEEDPTMNISPIAPILITFSIMPRDWPSQVHARETFFVYALRPV
jgi:hypothetical protein